MSIEFTLNCIESSDNKFAKELKDDIEDWNNVSSVIFSFLEYKTTNIIVIGLGKTGKTTFINTLLQKDYNKYKPTVNVSFNFLDFNNQYFNLVDFSSTQMYISNKVDHKTIDGIIIIMKEDIEYQFVIEWYKNIVRIKGRDVPKILIRNKQYYNICDCEYDQYYNTITIDVKNKDEVHNVFNKFLNVVNSF